MPLPKQPARRSDLKRGHERYGPTMRVHRLALPALIAFATIPAIAFANPEARTGDAQQRAVDRDKLNEDFAAARRTRERLTKRCGGSNNIDAIEVQFGSAKVRRSKGVTGDSRIDENGHTVFRWNYRKGWKLCYFQANYNFIRVEDATRFPRPTTNSQRGGTLRDSVRQNPESIDSATIVVRRTKR